MIDLKFNNDNIKILENKNFRFVSYKNNKNLQKEGWKIHISAN